MRQQILEALKAKFVGVSEQILSRIADKLAKTVTTAEDVKTVVDGVPFQQVLDWYGDSRATEAQQTAVKNYEKKWGLKEGKVVKVETTEEHNTEHQPQQQNGDDEPAWAKALIESNKALGEQVKAMQRQRVTVTRKQQLMGITSKLPESIRKAYDHIQLDNLSDEEFTDLVGKVTTEVDGIVKETQTRGAVFSRPGTGTGTGTSQVQEGELTPEQKAAIEHRATLLKAGGQPF